MAKAKTKSVKKLEEAKEPVEIKVTIVITPAQELANILGATIVQEKGNVVTLEKDGKVASANLSNGVEAARHGILSLGVF